MGMDVYGENPKIHTPKPQRPETEDYSSDEMSQYFSDLRKWQDKNVGAYFRNNVWWWRPLWNYVTELCDDILTEEDIVALYPWQIENLEIKVFDPCK